LGGALKTIDGFAKARAVSPKHRRVAFLHRRDGAPQFFKIETDRVAASSGTLRATRSIAECRWCLRKSRDARVAIMLSRAGLFD